MLKINNQDLISVIIRSGIDILDESQQSASDSDKSTPLHAPDDHVEESSNTSKHIALGSPLPSKSIGDIQEEFHDDKAFENFRVKLNKWLASRGVIPHGRRQLLPVSALVSLVFI